MVDLMSKSPFNELPKKNTVLGKEQLVSKKTEDKARRKYPMRIVSGKRQYQSIISPVTTKRERWSPVRKYAMLESLTLGVDNSNSSSLMLPYTLENLNAVVSDAAVPITAAEPPSPSLLPSPPQCWVGETTKRKLVEKRRCMDVTQSLVMHLASSGILATA